MGLAMDLPAAGFAGGAVTNSTTAHTYAVEGSSALGLVRYMNSHPVQGDHGAAYASIHPNYELTLVTAQRGSQCVPLKVSVNVDFDLILPVADAPGQMSGRTRAAWNAFAAFARGHEGHHKASYLGCAQAFVAQARRQSAGQCVALEFDLRTMLSQMKQDCETRQMAFDHAQARVLSRLALFSMARQQAAP